MVLLLKISDKSNYLVVLLPDFTVDFTGLTFNLRSREGMKAAVATQPHFILRASRPCCERLSTPTKANEDTRPRGCSKGFLSKKLTTIKYRLKKFCLQDVLPYFSDYGAFHSL